jgi:hypothetical protein
MAPRLLWDFRLAPPNAARLALGSGGLKTFSPPALRSRALDGARGVDCCPFESSSLETTKNGLTFSQAVFCGSEAGTRTQDQRINSPLLYQLSYLGMKCPQRTRNVENGKVGGLKMKKSAPGKGARQA